jgi:hypothetical protein
MNTETRDLNMSAVKSWLRSEITVKLPGWVLASGVLGTIVLLLVALD